MTVDSLASTATCVIETTTPTIWAWIAAVLALLAFLSYAYGMAGMLMRRTERESDWYFFGGGALLAVVASLAVAFFSDGSSSTTIIIESDTVQVDTDDESAIEREGC